MAKKLKGTQPAASQDLPQALNLHKQSSVASHSRERQGSVNNQGNNPGRVQIHLEGHLEGGYNLNPPPHKFSMTTQGTSTKNNEPKKFKFTGLQKEGYKQQPVQKAQPGIIASGQRFYSQDEMNPQSIQMMSAKNQSINSIDEHFAHDIQFQSQLTSKAKPEENKLMPKKKKIFTVRSGKSSQAESRGQQLQKPKMGEAQMPQQPPSAKLRKPSI